MGQGPRRRPTSRVVRFRGSTSSSEPIGWKSARGHKTPAALLVASYINVTVRRSIARLTCVDRPSAYQTGGQFDFAKNDLVGHHFLGTHARRQHGTHSKRGRVEPDARGQDARCVNPKPGGRRVERSTARPHAAREDPRERGNLTRCSTPSVKANTA